MNARAKFLAFVNEKKLHKELWGKRKDKDGGRSTAANENRNLKRKMKIGQKWHARVEKNSKPWLQNFLVFADRSTMTEDEKDAQTYIWAFLCDNPKVQVMQLLHATKITEWAITDAYELECRIRSDANSANKRRKQDRPEPIEKMENTFQNRNTDNFVKC